MKGRNSQRPVRAGDCRKLYACRVTGKTGTPSQRVTWCCTERHGFMLKHWKCVGLGHRDCPMRVAGLRQWAVSAGRNSQGGKK